MSSTEASHAEGEAVSVETLRAIADAFNAHDLDTIMDFLDVHYSDDRHWMSGNMGVAEWFLMAEKLGVAVKG